MPLKIDFKNFSNVVLTCSKCRSSIEVKISKHGSTKISDAIEKLDRMAINRGWTRDPDLCKKH